MRFQRLNSLDVILLSNGRKPSLNASKESGARAGAADDHGFPNCSHQEPKLLRVKPSSVSDFQSPNRDHFLVSSSEPDAVNRASPENVLFQWGHRKRSRGLRAEGRTTVAAVAAADEGDEPPSHSRQVARLQRRSSADTATPTALPPPGGPYATRTWLSCAPVRGPTASLANRSVEERSEGRARPEKRRSPEKYPKLSFPAAGSEAADGSMNPDPKQPPDLKPKERINLDHFAWPRIHLSLSRKEKEDDFMAMKGTKLPQRPKKRAKNIDKTLQYCYPGMWLPDLTRTRYEVREKKCTRKKKKRRRGLKGMESMDSESE
ncbi:uncharacterized protein LOC121970574 isoform X1 [Zingiber officinale]|uniref:uncharacterized protein LOC121970574 isoform X1 n=1 Tax=Zingiber officinale TaxID=94328 RepID=UPI001C4BC687|nr:uncharacterized protein LOC121970574 isoform X1 [Zingiber officinale]